MSLILLPDYGQDTATAAPIVDQLYAVIRERDEARAELRALKLAVLGMGLATVDDDAMALATVRVFELCGVTDLDALRGAGEDEAHEAIRAARAKLEAP